MIPCLFLASPPSPSSRRSRARAPAVAADYDLSPPLNVSAGQDLAGCTAGASADFASAYAGAEVEPQIAVNPLDPDEILGAAQQDRWPDGGARGLDVVVLGGRRAVVARLPAVPWSACQGGPAGSGASPTRGSPTTRAATRYFIGQPIDSAALGISAVSITSFDRAAGAWRPPQILIEDRGDRGAFNDKISVTGDPTRPGDAYATWLRGDYPNGGAQSENADFHSFAYRGPPMFSRTTDGARRGARRSRCATPTRTSRATRSRSLPDGTLLNVAAVLFRGAGIQPNGQGVFMAVLRSSDAGRTWSAPVKVAPLGTIATVQPRRRRPAPRRGLPARHRGRPGLRRDRTSSGPTRAAAPSTTSSCRAPPTAGGTGAHPSR